MKKSSVPNPITRAFWGIAAMVAIVFFGNWLMKVSPLGNHRLDLTEDRVHTLSDGTEKILKALDAPVVIRYYATRKTEALPRQMKLYMKTVDDFLAEYKAIAGDKLRIENLDPQPDTDAEDSAALDGISGQRIDEDNNFYFGLSISCFDQKTSIPFLNPAEQTLLEYRLSSAISEVVQEEKPVIGFMASLAVAGKAQEMGIQQQEPAWAIYQQITQAYDVRNLGMEPPVIPENIKVLLVIHPSQILPRVEYQIEQFVKRGGTLIACVDAFSITAQQAGGGNGSPFGGMSMIPTGSQLPNLFHAWGINFPEGRVLDDPQYRATMQNGAAGVAVLDLSEQAVAQKDEVITQNLGNLNLILPGAFSWDNPDTSFTPLIVSTDKAGFVPGLKASRLDPSVVFDALPAGKEFSFAVLMKGKFPYAYPDGDPSRVNPEKEEVQEGDEEPEKKFYETEGAVFLISDVDFISNQIGYRQINLFGGAALTPVNGNSTLLLNILDQAAGSNHLIGARSRASTRRPFTYVKKIEAAYEQKVGQKISELTIKQEEAVKRLQELQKKMADSKRIFMNTEQETELKQLQKDRVSYGKEIRELKKDLKKTKDQLASRMTIYNVVIVPCLVLMVAILVYSKRRKAAAAQ